MVEDHPIFNCNRYGRGWKQAPPCTPTHGSPKVPGDTFSRLVGVLMRTTSNYQ